MAGLAQGTVSSARSSSTGHRRLTTAVALTSLLLVAGSYVINAMDRQVFPVLLADIRPDFGFSLAQGGLLATIFTLGIGLSGVPTGYLLDRLSRKAVMLIGVLIYSTFTLLTALAVGYGDMFAYRTLSGVREGIQNAALFSAVGAYFFANRALALGSLNFAYGAGGFLGPQLGARLGDANGWRSPFYVYGGLGFLFVALIALFIRKQFTEQVEGDVLGSGAAPFLEHVPVNLYNRNILLLGLCAAAVGVAGYGYLGLYPTFLQNELGFSKVQAGTAASMFGLGALVGLPAGYLGDKLNQKWLLIGALLAGCVVGYLIFNGPTSVGAQYLLSFCQGAIASGFLFVNIYSSMQRSVRPAFIGRASGLFVTALYVPASLAGYLFAELVKAQGWGTAGLVQITLGQLVAVAAMLLVDPRRFSNASVAPTH